MGLSDLKKLKSRQVVNVIRHRIARLTSPACRFDPMEIGVFVTTRCNLACNTCPFTHDSPYSPQKNVPDLTRDLFARILDHHPGALVAGLVGGEPLLHADLTGLIEVAIRRKVIVNISTNGLLLDEETSRKLLAYPLGFLNVSIDASTPAEYERLRGRTVAVFERVIGNARCFGRIRSEVDSKTRFTISSVVDKGNITMMPDFVRLARDIGAHAAFFQNILPYECTGLTGRRSGLKDTEENRRILAGMRFPSDIQVVMPVLSPDDGSARVSCVQPFRLMSIDGAGNLSPCCVIPPHSRYGNLSDRMDDWKTGSEMMAVRSKMIDGRSFADVCLECWERFSLDRRKNK